MLSTLVVICLTAAAASPGTKPTIAPVTKPTPAPASAPVGPVAIRSLAAPGFQCANVDMKVVDSFMVHFAQQLASRGFQVQTPAEVGALLGLERQKQMLVCSDEGCNTEIAAALGVDALITGSIGKIGKGYLINIKIIHAKDGKAAAVFSARPKTDDEVLDFLEASAKRFADQYPLPPETAVVTMNSDAPTASPAVPTLVPQGTSATQAPGVATTAAPGPRLGPWVAGGAAVVALGVGGAFFAFSRATATQVRTGGAATNRAELERLADQGRTQEVLGVSGLVVGAALAATAVGLAAWGGDLATPNVALMPVPSGAVLAMGGAL